MFARLTVFDASTRAYLSACRAMQSTLRPKDLNRTSLGHRTTSRRMGRPPRRRMVLRLARRRMSTETMVLAMVIRCHQAVLVPIRMRTDTSQRPRHSRRRMMPRPARRTLRRLLFRRRRKRLRKINMIRAAVYLAPRHIQRAITVVFLRPQILL